MDGSRRGTHALVVGLTLLLAACGGASPPAGDEAARAETARLDAEFASRTQAARMAREEALTAPDGWTSLVGLHRIELRSHFIGSAPGSGLRLAHGPDRLGLLQSGAGGFRFTPERGVETMLDGEPLAGRATLRSDRDGVPSVLGPDDGRGALSIIERGGAAFVRVRHTDADARRRFAGLDYWPVDRGWRLDARFTPAPSQARIDIANILGMVEPTPTPGTVEFEHAGTSHVLHALEGANGGLFLILADRTSGHGSYSAGRYLDTAAPDAAGNVVLDFNRAYNPPCAFTPFATCPLPPAGNRLDLAIEAGEKAYRVPR